MIATSLLLLVYLWVCVMRNVVNNTLKGTELTIWQSLSRSWELYGHLLGGAIILYLGSIPIEVAIGIQCFVNLFMGLTDLKAKSLLRG